MDENHHQSNPQGNFQETIQKAIPHLLVMLTVMVLLVGVEGTFKAIQSQAMTLIKSFFGGEDVLMQVLLHTLPLAIAVAIATFSFAQGWLKLENVSSFVFLAGMVIAGAWIGGIMMDAFPMPANAVAKTEATKDQGRAGESAKIAGVPTSAGSTPDSSNTWQEIPIGNLVKQKKFAPVISAGVIGIPERAKVTVESKPSLQSSSGPLTQLKQMDWLAAPDLKNRSRKVKRLALLPESRSIFGIIAFAINQLLGYLIAYQPRLFLAAVLVGGWTGWIWHQRFEKIKLLKCK